MIEKEPKYVIIIKTRGYCKYRYYCSLLEILSITNKKPIKTIKRKELK